ncbi:MAG: polysaccharide deacetylase family protein [Chloroflexota bacterium]
MECGHNSVSAGEEDITDNVKAFLGAAMLVAVISVALVVTGVISDGGGDSASVSLESTPAVLGQTVTPGLSPTPEPGPATPITLPVDVPILMYHLIGPPDRPENERLAVATGDFAAQMSYLACAGYTPVTVQRLFDAFDGTAALPEKPIILTFDDGWAGQYTNGFSILQQHGFIGSFAIATGFVDAGGPYMTWAQIKEMSDAGHEMMSHTVTHIDLGTSDDATDIDQITESKSTLEAQTGKPADYFVYPAGEPFRSGSAERQGQVVQMLKDAGYRGALLANGRYGGQDPSAPFELNRVRVEGGEDIYTFAGSIYGPSPDSVSCS